MQFDIRKAIEKENLMETWNLYDYAIVGWKDGDRDKMPELLFASTVPRLRAATRRKSPPPR